MASGAGPGGRGAIPPKRQCFLKQTIVLRNFSLEKLLPSLSPALDQKNPPTYLQGEIDITVACSIRISVHGLVYTIPVLAHGREISLLVLHFRYTTTKSRRIVLDFRFQVKGSVFLLGTETNGDSNFYPVFQKEVFRRSRVGSSEKFVRG